MPTDLIPLQEAVARLRAHGLVLVVAPGEYVVNFHNGSLATEYRTDDLADALAHGLAMGPHPATLPPFGPTGTSKGSRRAKMYAHNRKIARRRWRQGDPYKR